MNGNSALPEVGVLAVGTELLVGQITNRNAAWISEQLGALGLSTAAHLAVADRRDDIVWGLQTLAARSSLIVLTGGLGPTSDDLTRDAVATFSGLPLEWHEGSWAHVLTTFATFGRTPTENNRQQCYFPVGARVLSNNRGSANAFFVPGALYGGADLVVLPGPPHEVAAVWEAHADGILGSRIPVEHRPVTRSLRTIGCGESRLAEMVEPIFSQERAAGPLTVAYRAHAPFVELKLTYPRECQLAFSGLVERVAEVLRPWLWERDHEDSFGAFAQALSGFASARVIDHATSGHLASQLGQALRGLAAAPSHEIVAPITVDSLFRSAALETCESLDRILAKAEGDAVFAVSRTADAVWTYGTKISGKVHLGDRPALWAGPTQRPRQELAIAFLVVKEWLEALKSHCSASDR